MLGVCVHKRENISQIKREPLIENSYSFQSFEEAFDTRHLSISFYTSIAQIEKEEEEEEENIKKIDQEPLKKFKIEDCSHLSS